VLTVRLAHLFEDAVGLDPDPAMIAEGDQAAQERDIANITWVQARAEELPAVAPGPYRLVTFGQSFYWTDEVPVAEAVYDMVEPGGALVVVGHRAEGRAVPPSPGPPRIPHDEIRELVQDVEGVLSNYFSMSFAAPHLFGDRVEEFADEVRELLGERSPEGAFWDWPGDTEVMLVGK
jgi:ubiquinone/menaquinone biosynthesis C-methylase UbiE